MTPFELDILLHYYCIAGDCRACVENVPIWAETRDKFLDQHLLELGKHPRQETYQLGDRGKVFIEHILSLPLPEWRMP